MFETQTKKRLRELEESHRALEKRVDSMDQVIAGILIEQHKTEEKTKGRTMYD